MLILTDWLTDCHSHIQYHSISLNNTLSPPGGNEWKPDSETMGSTDTGDYFPEGYNRDDDPAFSAGMGGSQAMGGGGTSGPSLPGMENLGADAVMVGGIEQASEIPAGMEFTPSSVPDQTLEFNVASSSDGACICWSGAIVVVIDVLLLNGWMMRISVFHLSIPAAALLPCISFSTVHCILTLSSSSTNEQINNNNNNIIIIYTTTGLEVDVDVKPVCMTFEDFYAAFSPDSNAAFSVTPATGRMDRRNGELTNLKLVIQPRGQSGVLEGNLVINLPEDNSKICYKIIANSQ